MGLGDAAVASVQSSATDATAGALLTPGAFGWGEVSDAPIPTDIDTIADPSGAYHYTGASAGTLPTGAATEGVLLHMQRGATGAAQFLLGGDNDGLYARLAASSAWGAWRRLDMPAGAVQAFAMTTSPDGWLECDGSDVSRTTYAGLFAAIGTTFGSGDGSTTFGLPDLRGEFVRGWDNGRGVDSGRAHGSAQSDALKSHTHDLSILVGTSDTSRIATTADGGTGDSGHNPTATATGGAETRPRNIALMYCIKV